MTRTSTARRADQNRASQAAAIRARLERQRRRNRMILGGATAAVVAVVAVIAVIASMSGGGAATGKPTVRDAVAPALLQQVTQVPASTLDAVGPGAVWALPKPVSGASLTKDGKPLALYIGSEYCPYCAAERWPMVQALSRFGTFTGLRETTSAADDVFPSTPTFTFHGASYTSDYLAFEGPEVATNSRVNGKYQPLDRLTAQQQQLFDRNGGGTPQFYIGGVWFVGGSLYDPKVLTGKSFDEIAGSLADPSSKVAKAIDGAANVLTAALCKVTSGQPANVCTAPGVKAAAAQLPAR